MKKFILFLFFPSISFASGTVQLQSNGTGGGSVTIVGNSGGGTSSGGVSVYPATSTIIIPNGINSSTETLTSLSPGVMHIISVSSVVTTGLVSLSTEVTGILPLANMTSLTTFYINNQNTLQSGATSYPSFSYIGSSETVFGPLEVKGPTGIIISSNGLSGTINYSSGTLGLGVSTNTLINGILYVVSGSTLSSVIGNGLIVDGHIEVSSTTPTASSCGTSPSPSFSTASNDQWGTITVGGGVVTSCTVTFAVPWVNKPSCNIISGTAVTSPTMTSTTTGFVFGGSAINGDVMMYQCGGGR